MPDLDFKAPAYTCPLCQTFSQQSWVVTLDNRTGQLFQFQDLWFAVCLKCQGRTIWYQTRLVAPIATSAPPPNEDMPEDIRVDFEEARDIAERSPRSAAGLLRLCIQKLCIHFGEPGDNLNADIASLVMKGLPVEIQQAFDGIRIVGNSQLHPDDRGFDIRANPNAVPLLFTLANMIVDNKISLPRKTREFYSGLPESTRNAVDLRQQKALKKG